MDCVSHAIRVLTNDDPVTMERVIDNLREDVDIEIVHEGESTETAEAGMNRRYQTCKKNPGHTQFCPIQEVSLGHLPERWQDPKVLEKIRYMSARTVHLTVAFTSPDRPDDYGFDMLRGTPVVRVGSGFAPILEDDELGDFQPCPLPDCPISEPHFVTPEFNVHTATHVVYNTAEALKTKVSFFLDTDDKTSVVSAEGYRMLFSNGSVGESGIFSCVSHDLDLFHKIFAVPNVKIPSSLSLLQTREPMVIVLSHPHGVPKKFTCGDWVDVEKVPFDSLKFMKKTMGNLKLESLIPALKPLIPSLEQEVGLPREFLEETVSEIPTQFSGATVADMIPVIQPLMEQGIDVLNIIPKNALDNASGEWMQPLLENMLPHMGTFSPGANMVGGAQSWKEVMEENPGQTFGQLTGGEHSSFNLSYIGYNTPTCQGSSGAPVFLFFDGDNGEVNVFWAATHFGTRYKRNVSCFTHDIPDVLHTHPSLEHHVSKRHGRKGASGGKTTAPSAPAPAPTSTSSPAPAPTSTSSPTPAPASTSSPTPTPASTSTPIPNFTTTSNPAHTSNSLSAPTSTPTQHGSMTEPPLD